MVPGLNKTYAKYAEQGLVIVGVTNEGASLVDVSIPCENDQRLPSSDRCRDRKVLVVAN